MQLLCHDLEHTGNVADDLLAALAAVALGAGGGHQLQVVDDDKAQVVDAAALGVHIRHREHRVIVDENIEPGENRGGVCNVDPVGLAEVARHEPLVFDRRLIRQNARDELLARHFEREDGHGLPARAGDVQRKVQRHTRFAHTGTRGQQHKVGLVETVHPVVQHAETRGKARQGLAAVGAQLA